MRTIKRKAKDPQKVRLIEINDPHWAASSPPAFKNSYKEHLDENIAQVFRAAIKHDVDGIIWSGDIFHLKEPRNNPHWLVADVIEQMQTVARDGKLIHGGVAGNHDLRYGSLEAGLKGSAFDTLVRSRTYHLLDREELFFEGDEFSVRCAGGSYLHGQADHVRDKVKQGANYLVAVGHFWLGMQTGEFFGEPLFGLEYFKDSEVDVLCVGHHHEDKGVHNLHGKTFVAQGSISITGTHPHDLTRAPAAALIEITREGVDVKVLRPKRKPIEELLDLEKHEQVKQERKDVQEFIEQLASAQLESADPKEILNELAPSEQVRERALQYIDGAENPS